MLRRNSPPTRAHRNRPYRGGTRIVLQTLGDITQGRGLILQTHFDYAPGLENIVIHKGINEDFLTGNQESISRQKLDLSDQPLNQDLLNQNLNLLTPLTSPWRWKIPPSVEIPFVDWSQLTSELLEQGQGEEKPSNLVKDLHGWTGQLW